MGQAWVKFELDYRFFFGIDYRLNDYQISIINSSLESIIDYQFLFGIEPFTNLVALCEGNNGARWKVHLAEQEVHGVENVWLQGATSLHLRLKTWRKKTRWQECIKMALKGIL